MRSLSSYTTPVTPSQGGFVQWFDLLRDFLRGVPRAVLDILYPPVCCWCLTPLDSSARHICSGCWKGINRIDSTHRVWQELRVRLVENGTVSDIAACFLFEKEGALQKMIHGLKYEGKTSIGRLLGRELGSILLARDVTGNSALLVPVPLHRLKERERGYNQSTCICRGIADVTGIPVVNSLLLRKKYTGSQTHLHLEERRKNVLEAFAINNRDRARVRGSTIILVDDVMTTGATINECAAVLRRGGATDVIAASVALAS
jgi:ComF family protein